MPKFAVILLALCALPRSLPAVTPPAKEPAPQRRIYRGRSSHTRQSSTLASRSGAKTSGHSGRSSYVGTPSSERYQQIQQALAAKGYFKGDANGKWGPDSVDALKRFQTEQNLQSDGKLGSLSLIALGLGPKRTTAAKPAAPAATEPPPSGDKQ